MIKAIEFLYAVELLRTQPDDFQKAYENTYGTLEDYGEYLKKTYNPYFVEVISKLFYQNLAKKLTQTKMPLNDVFYLISLYELDLEKDIPFSSSGVREKYEATYQNYVEMQSAFFQLLQQNSEINLIESFQNYRMTYGEESLCADASLSWLAPEKKEYLLKRNQAMYQKNPGKMLFYQSAEVNAEE